MTRCMGWGAWALALSVSSAAWAGPHGYDLHNTLMPASGGMAGTSLAQPQDLPSALYGNPATLAQFKGTQFTFGATFYNPEVTLTHDGSVTGAAFSGRSQTKIFPVPNVAVTQDLSALGVPATLGLGITAVSGIGAEFKSIPQSLGAGAEFIVFGVNAGLGWQLTPSLALGGALTISFAQLDAGLSSTSAEVHDLGMRGTLGLTYAFAPNSTIGVFYQSKLAHDFDNLFQTGTVNGVFPVFSSQRIEQPQNFGLGIAIGELMNGRLLLAADVMYKQWSRAAFWQDVFDDQWVYSLGAQLSSGKWRYRVGYGYADDPNRDNPTRLGSLTQVVAGPAGLTIPLTTPVIQYLQATQTEVIYKHRLTAGIGYKGLLIPALDVDAHAGWQFKEGRDFGTHTRAEVHSWHVGFGLTWRF